MEKRGVPEGKAPQGEGRGRAVLLALATVVCWSTVATGFKLALERVSAFELVAGSSFFAAVFLLPAVFRERRERAGAVWGVRPGWWIRIAVLGFLNPFLYYLVLFSAYDLLPARFAQPLNYTWPLVLSVLAVPFLGQRLDRRGIGGILLGLAGVAVLSSDGKAALAWPSLTGAFLALGSSVIWAAYWIGSRRMAESAESAESAGGEQTGRPVPGPAARLAGFFGAGFLWLLAARLFLRAVRPETLLGAFLPWDNPAWWWGSAFVGLMEMALPFSLWSAALAASDQASRITPFIYLAPFLSLLPIHFVLGEPIPPTTVGGLAILVAGIGLQGRQTG